MDKFINGKIGEIIDLCDTDGNILCYRFLHRWKNDFK